MLIQSNHSIDSLNIRFRISEPYRINLLIIILFLYNGHT